MAGRLAPKQVEVLDDGMADLLRQKRFQGGHTRRATVAGSEAWQAKAAHPSCLSDCLI